MLVHLVCTHQHTHPGRGGGGGELGSRSVFCSGGNCLVVWHCLPLCLPHKRLLYSNYRSAIHTRHSLFPTETKGEEPGSVFNWCWRTNCFCVNCLKALFTDTSLDPHSPSSQRQQCICCCFVLIVGVCVCVWLLLGG